jgi:putative glutamine amidotransferase
MLAPMTAGRGPAPRVVVTLLDPARHADPAIAARKNALCIDSVVRHGAAAIPLDATASDGDRAGAFASMDGLLLTGGPDIDPDRYGTQRAGTGAADAARDALDAAAWEAADRRGLPVLGICRGFQAMNVFAGGRLLQHVDGHAGPAFGGGPALTHPLRVVPGTKLARILFPTNVGGGVLAVNSSHHQAVRPSDLAPGLVACGLSPSAAGDLVEAFEAPMGPFRVGVQSHPERTDSTPRQFERLFAFFVDACRGPLGRR